MQPYLTQVASGIIRGLSRYVDDSHGAVQKPVDGCRWPVGMVLGLTLFDRAGEPLKERCGRPKPIRSRPSTRGPAQQRNPKARRPSVPGHTEMLTARLGTECVYTMFIVGTLGLFFLTRHYPLRAVPDRLTAPRIQMGFVGVWDFPRN